MATILENRQARHLYFIEESLKAGLVLEGWEVKAILAGRANFNGGGAFIRITDGEAWLEGMTVSAQHSAHQGLLLEQAPVRSRKLLLKSAEIAKLSRKVLQKGYTLVPLEVLRERKLKLIFGVAKGKSHADKRDVIKQRDVTRDIQRELSRHG